MNNIFIEELRLKIKDALIDDNFRYIHSINVANTCACLAMRYGYDYEKAYIAGLLHDCAKCIPDDVKIKECIENNLKISDIEYNSPYLLHSKLGAFYAKKIYGITDSDICSSIEFHTTARADMSLLEKIVFISDYIEPYRNKAMDLDEIRSLVFVDIDKAIYICLKDTIEYLKIKGRSIDETTKNALSFYEKLMETRND